MGWSSGTIPDPAHPWFLTGIKVLALCCPIPEIPGIHTCQAGISCPNPDLPAAGMGGGIMGWIPKTIPDLAHPWFLTGIEDLALPVFLHSINPRNPRILEWLWDWEGGHWICP